MASPLLKEFMAHVTPVFSELKTTVKTQDAEIRENKETSVKTAKKMQTLEDRLDGIVKEFTDRVQDLEAKGNRLLSGGSGRESKSLLSQGDTFINSSEYKEFKENRWTGTSKRCNVPSSFQTEFKDLIGTADPTNSVTDLRTVLSIERVLEIIRNPIRTMRIRDLFPVFPTQNNSIEFPREVLFTNNAATVSEGASKPESIIQFEDKNVVLRTLAHWIPVNNQLLEDVAALRAYIDTRLMEGLKLKEDVQLLYGTGVDPDIQGLLTEAEVPVQKESQGKKSDTRIDTLRRAITRARLAEFPVDGIVLSPQDWAEIEMTKGTTNHYVWISVSEGGIPRLWRVPIVDTTAINPGDALVGAFRMGAAVWDRNQAGIRVTDSHSDYFVRNKTVVLAEERICLTTFRPQSFVKCSFDSTGTGS